LLTQYANTPANDRSPLTLETLTIAPRRAARCGAGHHLIPHFVGRVLQRSGRDNARCVHEHVDAAKRVDGRPNDAGGSILLSDVGLTGRDLRREATHLTRHLRKSRQVPAYSHHLGTVGRKGECRRSTDAARRPSHHNRLSLE
jgi:hypothetical protein